VPKAQLAEAAREDALRVRDEHGAGSTVEVEVEVVTTPAAETVAASGSVGGVDLGSVGQKDASAIQSEEQKALGYRPPAGSLAAEAQAAAAQHPDASTGLPPSDLKAAADADAVTTEVARADTSVDLGTISKDEARTIQSAEQQILGYRPPKGSLAAEAQSAADKDRQ
jgi:hypothetical protein